VKVKLRQSSPVFKNSLALGMAEDGGSSPRRKCCHDIKIHLFFFFSFDFSKQTILVFLLTIISVPLVLTCDLEISPYSLQLAHFSVWSNLVTLLLIIH
jgi:hypothetical protein